MRFHFCVFQGDDDVVHAFRVFDRDGDGLISAEELKLTMNNLGEPLTDYEVRSMIEAADLDGDGRINFDEFARLMQQGVFEGGGPPPSTNHSPSPRPSSASNYGSAAAAASSASKNQNGKCV